MVAGHTAVALTLAVCGGQGLGVSVSMMRKFVGFFDSYTGTARGDNSPVGRTVETWDLGLWLGTSGFRGQIGCFEDVGPASDDIFAVYLPELKRD